jgi:hypothetical protein
MNTMMKKNPPVFKKEADPFYNIIEEDRKKYMDWYGSYSKIVHWRDYMDSLAVMSALS